MRRFCFKLGIGSLRGTVRPFFLICTSLLGYTGQAEIGDILDTYLSDVYRFKRRERRAELYVGFFLVQDIRVWDKSLYFIEKANKQSKQITVTFLFKYFTRNQKHS